MLRLAGEAQRWVRQKMKVRDRRCHRDRKAAQEQSNMDCRRPEKIAEKLGGIKVGRARSNEYEIDNRKVVIKCARATTNSVGVPYQMLNRVAAILGSFETANGTYDIYEMRPDTYRQHLRPTRSTGPSAGRVGIVRKLAFVDRGKFLMNLHID